MSFERCVLGPIVVMIAGLCGSSSIGAEPVQAGPFTFLFATQQQGRELLESADSFTAAMSPFDRQVRMRTKVDPGEGAFRRFAGGEALDWPADDRAAVNAAISAIEPALRKLRTQKTDRIWLVHTTGIEEAGAAYTRGESIVIPKGETGSVGKPRSKLIAHELFHILSRNDPELRDRLYLRIGFRRVGAVQLPRRLAELKITNPDAPTVEHVMDVELEPKRTVSVAPVLYAKEPYRTRGPRGLFSYLSFRLMEVIPMVGKQYIAKTDDGEPVLHRPELPDFHRQIGRNTGYIIHPEEILADNFAFLITGETDKPDRWLIDAMRESFFKESDRPR